MHGSMALDLGYDALLMGVKVKRVTKEKLTGAEDVDETV